MFYVVGVVRHNVAPEFAVPGDQLFNALKQQVQPANKYDITVGIFTSLIFTNLVPYSTYFTTTII